MHYVSSIKTETLAKNKVVGEAVTRLVYRTSPSLKSRMLSYDIPTISIEKVI